MSWVTLIQSNAAEECVSCARIRNLLASERARSWQELCCRVMFITLPSLSAISNPDLFGKRMGRSIALFSCRHPTRHRGLLSSNGFKSPVTGPWTHPVKTAKFAIGPSPYPPSPRLASMILATSLLERTTMTCSMVLAEQVT